jgi:hypothetical protein
MVNYIKRIQVEIQSPTHRNLIGLSMTAPLPVIAHQCSSANFVSISFQSREEKFGTNCKNAIISFFLLL